MASGGGGRGGVDSGVGVDSGSYIPPRSNDMVPIFHPGVMTWSQYSTRV